MRIIRYVYLSGLVLIPIVLILLPADFFDTGQSICMSVLLFDQTCYGCGMTRALQHLVHLDFEAAANFNKLSFVVLPLLVYMWYKELRVTYHRIKNFNPPPAG